jgi:hypothetical protein
VRASGGYKNDTSIGEAYELPGRWFDENESQVTAADGKHGQKIQ